MSWNQPGFDSSPASPSQPQAWNGGWQGQPSSWQSPPPSGPSHTPSWTNQPVQTGWIANPPPQRPGRGRLIGLIGALVGLLVLALAGVAVWTGGDDTADPAPAPVSTPATVAPSTPSAPATTVGATPASSPATTEPATPEDTGPTMEGSEEPTPTEKPKGAKVLTANALYQQSVFGACPPQNVPTSRDEYEQRVRDLLACQEAAWPAQLTVAGYGYRDVHVRFYAGRSVSSPCGTAEPRFPAFYCPANQTIYLAARNYDYSKTYRLETTDLVFHEYAHHIQYLVGITDATRRSPEKRPLVMRRFELQALCFSHYSMTHNRGIGVTREDVRSLAYRFDHPYDSLYHGSSKSRWEWGTNGLEAENLGACNTYAAPAGKVS